jgi:fibronectin-binding autotransporter adhesin
LIGNNNQNTTYSGALSGSGANGVTKIGTGTLTLSGNASSYTGPTVVQSGVLSIGALADGGTASSIGAAANAAGNLVLQGGALRYTTAGAVSCDRAFTLIANSTIALPTAGTSVTLGRTGVASLLDPYRLSLTGGAGSSLNIGNVILASALGGGTTLEPSIALAVGSVTGSATGGRTDTLILDGMATGNSVTGAISDGGAGGQVALMKSNAGTWTLTAANTYSGDTLINAGTLALSGSGSMPGSPNISVASGATFDVSARSSSLTLPGQTLKAGATGGNTTGMIAVGPSAGLTLSGGLVFSALGGANTAAPLTVAGPGGSLALNNAPVTVTTTTALPAGPYILIGKGGAATVTGTPGTLTVNGSGTVIPGAPTSLSVVSGELILTVGKVTTSISNVTPTQTNTVGDVLTLAGTVSAAGSVYPTNGSLVLVTLSNSTYCSSASNTYVSGAAGRFTNLFDTVGIPGAAEAYTVTYVYSGDSDFSGTTNSDMTVTLPPTFSPGTLIRFR